MTLSTFPPPPYLMRMTQAMEVQPTASISDPDPNFPPPLSAEGDVLVSAWSDDSDDGGAGEEDEEDDEVDDTKVAESQGKKEGDEDDVVEDTKDNEDVGDEGDDEEDEDEHDGSERVEIGLAPEGSQSQVNEDFPSDVGGDEDDD